MKKNLIINYIFMALLVGLFSLVITSCEQNDELKIYAYPEPTVDSFSPVSGRPGTLVTITGSDFGTYKGAVSVFFNGFEVSKDQIISVTDNAIVVAVPEDASTGVITVKVWTHTKDIDGTFEYIPGAKITSVDPPAGLPGDLITINGTSFVTDLNLVSVNFNGLDAQVISVSETQIVVKVPQGVTPGFIGVVFEGIQTIAGPFFSILGELEFDLTSVSVTEFVEKGGTITIGKNGANVIDGTQNNGYVIYKFTAPVDGFYSPYAFAGSDKPNGYMNIDLGTSLTELKGRAIKPFNTQHIIDLGSWSDTQEYIYPETYLSKGQEYFFKVTFLQGSPWVANVYSLGIKLVDLPKGKYIFEFDDSSKSDWTVAQNGTAVIADGKLKVTFDPIQFVGTAKRRADLYNVINNKFPYPNGAAKESWTVSPDYPIFAIKITFTGTGAPKPTVGNLVLDPSVAGGANAGNNKYKTDYLGNNVIYYDLTADYPTATDLATRQLKVADLTGVETGYEVDWIRTFKNAAELQAFLQ